MKPYQERLITLLKDTITLLCRNGLEYSQEFSVEGLLGVTLDKNDVFLIPIKELITDKCVGSADAGDITLDDTSDDASLVQETKQHRRERPKKRHHHDREMLPAKRETSLSSCQQNTSASEWPSGSELKRPDDSNDLSKNYTSVANDQPVSKRRHREDSGTNSPQTSENIKAEDVVVIKEEIDDSEFASAFQDGSLDSNSQNQAGDNTNIDFFSQPGTSHSQLGFPLDQLHGVPGAMPGMPPGAEGNDSMWLQQVGDDGQRPPDWQQQKHQVQCHICWKKFNRPAKLERHISGVHFKTRFDCDICGKSYSQKDNLSQHIKLHHIHKTFDGNSITG